jgi:DNA-directed RNA polymerase specialized sigma24 family protein
MRPNAFPTTLHTWISRRLVVGGEGRAEVNRHVMSVYAWPLAVYFRGTRDRWLGEAEDIVQGFFADRLAREHFFVDWLQSGLPLRRWLMNAFCFYLNEVKRKRKRDRVDAQPSDEHVDTGAKPEDVLDRAFVVSVIRRALQQTHERCAAQGLEQHWRIFIRHHYQSAGYQQIAEEFGVDVPRAAVMARTAARKFRDVVRDLLMRDGAPPDHVDGEIQTLLEVTGT